MDVGKEEKNESQNNWRFILEIFKNIPSPLHYPQVTRIGYKCVKLLCGRVKELLTLSTTLFSVLR